MIPASELLTATEAAGYLKVKVRTLLLWVRQGKVKGFALSGTKHRVWRFRKSDLDAALLESPVLPSEALSVRSEGEDFLKRAARVNQGSVVFNKRFGTWNFLWCENGHRRFKLIGTLREFPTKASARRAAEPFRKPRRDGNEQ
jgi:excisionase family DNA binding protein